MNESGAMEDLNEPKSSGVLDRSGVLIKPSTNPDVSTTAYKRAQDGTQSQTFVERTAEHITESTHQVSRATGAIADAFEDSVGVMRRAVRQSGDAAEEFLNDTTRRLQRHVVLTVAMTFAGRPGALIVSDLSWAFFHRD